MKQFYLKNKHSCNQLVLLIIVLACYQLLDIKCLIRDTTGIPCPLCGMTRAWLSIIKLNVAGALYYHPLFLLAPLIVYQIVTPNKNKHQYTMIGVASLFLVVYIMRLLFFIIP